MTTTTKPTFDRWRHLADCVILWRTTDDLAARNALLDKIAAKCIEIESGGGVASIWHATSLVLGTTRCPCFQCEPPNARR